MGKTSTWNYAWIMFVGCVQRSEVPTMQDWGHSCHNPQLTLSPPHGWVTIGVQLVPVDYQLHQFPIQIEDKEYVVSNAKILKHLPLQLGPHLAKWMSWVMLWDSIEGKKIKWNRRGSCCDNSWVFWGSHNSSAHLWWSTLPNSCGGEDRLFEKCCSL